MNKSFHLQLALTLLNQYQERLNDRKVKSNLKAIYREIHHRLKKLVLLHHSSSKFTKEQNYRLLLTVEKFVFMGIY